MQAPDSCGPNSCTLYSGYYKVKHSKGGDEFPYGLTAGAYKGRINGGAQDKPEAAPDPSAGVQHAQHCQGSENAWQLACASRF